MMVGSWKTTINLSFWVAVPHSSLLTSEAILRSNVCETTYSGSSQVLMLTRPALIVPSVARGDNGDLLVKWTWIPLHRKCPEGNAQREMPRGKYPEGMPIQMWSTSQNISETTRGSLWNTERCIWVDQDLELWDEVMWTSIGSWTLQFGISGRELYRWQLLLGRTSFAFPNHQVIVTCLLPLSNSWS